MAKPLTTALWPATGHIVEPSPAKKTQGWLPGDQPPAEFMNWFFNLVGQYTGYVFNLETIESLTWALAQTFNKGITVGANFTANETEAISPRVTANPVSSAVADYTNLLTAKDARVWSEGVGSDSSLVFTVNATRTTAGADTWTKITNSQPAIALFVSRNGVSIGFMPAAQNTAWAGAFIEGDGTTAGWGRLLFLHSSQTAETDAEQDVAVHNTQVNATGERKLLWSIKNGSRGVRLYYVRNGGPNGGDGFEVAINCTYGNVSNNWTHDTTNTCMKFSFSSSELVVQWKVSAAAGTAFTDNAWTLTPFNLVLPTAASGTGDFAKAILGNGTFSVVNTQIVEADDANPPAQSAQANKFGVRNTNKVLASITSGASPSVQSGYNLAASSPITTLSSVLTLAFNTALSDNLYECVVTCEDASTGNFYLPQVVAKAPGNVSIAVAKLIVGGAISLVDLGATAIKLNIHITGKQTT